MMYSTDGRTYIRYEKKCRFYNFENVPILNVKYNTK